MDNKKLNSKKKRENLALALKANLKRRKQKK